MTSGEEYLKLQRRNEADLLICRLIGEWAKDRKLIQEIRADSQDKARMAADPNYVSDNLSDFPPSLQYFDLQRLLTLVRQGF